MMDLSVWHRLRELPSKTLWALAPRRRVMARGLRLSLQCDNAITEYRWKSYNTKEPETLDWIDAWIRPGDVMFDVGANIGLYSLYAALRHPTAKVIAFEPEYANLHLLRDNILENGVQERVDVYSIALGNRNGVSRLHIQDVTPGAALHTEARSPLTETRTHHPVVWREGVCTMTLDAFCEEVGVQPQAIKLDVDGTEPEILEGAAQTLRNPSLRSVLMEMFGDLAMQRTCASLLGAAGFQKQTATHQGYNEIWAKP